MAVNWSGDVLPSLATPDTALWDGTVAGPLMLLYTDASLAGVAGNTGLNVSVAGTQTSTLNIDSGANLNALRMNNITIAASAGAFSLGNSAGTFNLTLGGVAGQTHTWANNSANTATVASDVFLGLGGGGTHTLALGGAGNWALNNLVSGAIILTKNDAGVLTLTGANTHTGGTVLNAGTLNLNSTAAIGAGALTINGGTLDNTFGVALLTTTAKAQNWNGDFTFTGGAGTTHDLNFNGGVATLGGAGAARQATVSAGTLTVGSFVGAGYGLTKAGAGTLTAGTAASRITGVLNVTGGKVQIGISDFVAGGLAGSATIENGSATTRWLFVQNTADNQFSGTLQNGAGAGLLGLAKAGTGTLTLTGTNTYTSQTTVGGGTLEFGSAATAGITQSVGNLSFTAGDNTVKSSFNGTGTASLTFLASEARAAGGTANFAISGGTNGADNKINLTKAAGYIDHGTFFGGSNYATMNAVNTYVRALSYGVDAGAVTSGTTATLASATHQEFTGDITAQGTATFTTLKDNGNNAFTLAGGATVTTAGILKSGNVAGGATISGGAGIQAATSGGELVVRVDGANDALDIATPILANGASLLTTSGAGTLTLSAANTFTGTATINSKVILSGSLLLPVVNLTGGGVLTLPASGKINDANAASGQVNIGAAAGGNAVLNINGGTLKAGKTASPSLAIGNAANSSGFVNMTSGTLSTVSELHIGNGTGAAGANPYAALTVSGGAVTSGNWLVLGANNDRAVLNQSGGTITVAANRMTIGAGAGGAGSVGVANLSGGTFTDAAGIFVGENGTGTLNMSGSGSLSLGTTGTLQFAGNATSIAGTVNLLGGNASVGQVTKGTGTGTYLFNFNGGKLTAAQSSGAFFAALANTTAYVYSGGGTVDNGGNAITIAQPLLAPTGNGVNGVASFTGGAGYLDTPVVVIQRGIGDTTGVGATAVANVAGGVVTGITITNPGTGYTLAPIFQLFGGGGTTAATVTSAAPTANTSGGMTFNGTGNTTLTGQNAGSYTGGTTVNSGTLTLTGANNGTGIIRGALTVNAGASVVATTANAIGYNSGTSVTAANIIGGTLNTTAAGDQGFNTTYNLTGGTLTSNGGVSSAAAASYWVLGRINAGVPDNDAVNSLASANVSTIAGRLHLRSDNGNNNVPFTVANGAAAVDLMVSAAVTEGGSVGITKAGAGRMEMSGGNTYTGATSVSNGTLALSGTGAVNSSIGITVNGAGAKFLQNSSVAVAPTVTLTQGTIDGTGTINTVNAAAGTVIANGDGGTGVLTIGTLTHGSPATYNLTTASTAPVLALGTLTTNGGIITINATNSSWTNGLDYNLIGYTTLNGVLADFTKGAVANLGARQSATLTNPAGFIALTIAGDLPVWTGLQSGSWTTNVIGGSSNWKLQTGATATDFIVNDTVLFDDTITTGTTAVTINVANVTPISTTFNNTANNYTVTGGFGIASGTLIKNGAGTVTLGTANTYTGPTSVNNGVFNLTGSLGNTAVTVAAPATLSLQAAGAISQNTVTVNGTITQTVNNALSGTAALVLNNGATLGSTNAHSGGTTLNAGTLLLNHNTAVGTGTFTISGGTIDNTSGGLVTLTNNNAQIWTGGAALNFTGTNALNLGAGAVALGADATAGTFTITNNSGLGGTSLTVPGPVTSGVGGAGVKTLNIGGVGGTVLSGNITTGGASALVLNDNVAATLTLSGAASSISTLNLNGGAGSIVELLTGNLGVANGGASIVQSTTGGTINGTGGGAIVLGSNLGDFGTVGGTTLTVNAKISGGNGVDFWNANGGAGFGTVVLTAANNYTGVTNVQNTKVVIPVGGSINATNTANIGQITVGDNNVSQALLSVEGGTINATKNTSPSIAVGSVAGAVGAINMTSGTINTTSEFHLGRGAGGYGAFTMSGGAVTSGNWFVVGFNNDRAVFNQSGGSLALAANRMTIGAGGAGSIGVVNQSGGTFTSAAGANTGIYVGENGTGTYTLSGTGAITLNTNGAVASGTLQFAGNASSLAGNFNLNGGTVTAFGVTKGASTAGAVYAFNFNGGTLKANANNPAFFASLANTSAYVNGAFGAFTGGGTIDDGGFNVTIAQPLLAPTGSGVSSIAVSGGTGYLATPLVLISGTGTGATAIANIDGSGNLTGITITNPGVNYTSAPTVTLAGGGGTGAVIGAVGTAANTSGGLTKQGSGRLTLTGVQTYAVLTGSNGTTNLKNTLGTGSSIINANASVATDVSQTLAELNIGAGGLFTLSSTPLPGGENPAPAPAEALFATLPEFAADAPELAAASGPAAVPEPGSLALLASGALALLRRRRR